MIIYHTTQSQSQQIPTLQHPKLHTRQPICPNQVDSSEIARRLLAPQHFLRHLLFSELGVPG